MAARAYYVKDVSVTGVSESPQTIAFSSLTDVDGSAVPTTFAAAPYIGLTKKQDRGAYITARTTTNFTIALSDIGDLDASCAFDLHIGGESA